MRNYTKLCGCPHRFAAAKLTTPFHKMSIRITVLNSAWKSAKNCDFHNNAEMRTTLHYFASAHANFTVLKSGSKTARANFSTVLVCEFWNQFWTSLIHIKKSIKKAKKAANNSITFASCRCKYLDRPLAWAWCISRLWSQGRTMDPGWCWDRSPRLEETAFSVWMCL